jgi:hypothetical protein
MIGGLRDCPDMTYESQQLDHDDRCGTLEVFMLTTKNG